MIIPQMSLLGVIESVTIPDRLAIDTKNPNGTASRVLLFTRPRTWGAQDISHLSSLQHARVGKQVSR